MGSRLRLPGLLLVACIIQGAHFGSASSNKGLEDLAVTRYASLVEELWTYRPELPKRVLDMAVKMNADRSRLDRAVAKMISGQPVKVVALGGSVSLRGWNKIDEAFTRQVHKWLELTFVPGCRQEAEKMAEEEKAEASEAAAPTDLRRFIEELPMTENPAEGEEIHRSPAPTALHSLPSHHYRATGHMCSGSHIEFISLAVPAAGPGYAERCVLQHMPIDADIVIVDFGANDYQLPEKLSNPERHALERIFRTLLVLPNRPAIVLFELYSWMQALGSYTGGGKTYGISLAEDKHVLIAEYYGNIQALSVRAALWQILHASGDDDARLIYLGKEIKGDFTHITAFGHRWYADILINYLRDISEVLITKAALAASWKDIRGSSNAAKVMADRLPGGAEVAWDETNWAGDKAEGSDDNSGPEANARPSCSIVGNLGVRYPVHCSPDGLKPPFFKDNEAEPAGVCAIGLDFVGIVSKPHSGWEWVDEGRNGEHKWGFVSFTPGSVLTLKVDISKHVVSGKGLGVEAGGSGGLRTRLREISGHIIFLQSWTEMGTAEMICSGGCMCDVQRLEATYGDTGVKATTPKMHRFYIMQKKSGDSEECIVTVTLLEESQSAGNHRFKVVGFTTSTNPVWHMEEILKRGDDKYVAG